MKLSLLEEALLPYEKRLHTQEKLRRLIGVKELDRPTYERYITGNIERFDSFRNISNANNPSNPFGDEFRKRFKSRTGYKNFKDFRRSLSYSDLEIEDRIGLSLNQAGWRLNNEYHPNSFPVTPVEGRVEVYDPVWMSRLIKKVALMFGAEMVRITKVNQRWLYLGVNISHKYAIVLVVSHKHSLIDTAPSFLSGLAAGNTYSRLIFISSQLTDFICGLGYEAAYRETAGPKPDILVVPTAIDAGVGELARNGHALSPEFGINMRIKIVTTDLPLAIDKPISFGVHDFCSACENCATYCPASAIPHGPPTDQPIDFFNNAGFRKWYFNAERCQIFWSINKKKWDACGGRCIVACPWNNPTVPFHNMVRWLAIHSPSTIKKILTSIDWKIHGRSKKIAIR